MISVERTCEVLAQTAASKVPAPPVAVKGGPGGAGYLCANPECGHGRASHDLARDNRTRTRCSHISGPKGTPCPCTRYTPAEGDDAP